MFLCSHFYANASILIFSFFGCTISLWDLSSPTRDWTQALGYERVLTAGPCTSILFPSILFILFCEVKWKALSRVQLFVTPRTIKSMKFSRPEYWSGWPAFPFSRGSSQPRDRTQVSRIAGRFFTSWAIREAHNLSRAQHNFQGQNKSVWMGLESGTVLNGARPPDPGYKALLCRWSHKVFQHPCAAGGTDHPSLCCWEEGGRGGEDFLPLMRQLTQQKQGHTGLPRPWGWWNVHFIWGLQERVLLKGDVACCWRGKHAHKRAWGRQLADLPGRSQPFYNVPQSAPVWPSPPSSRLTFPYRLNSKGHWSCQMPEWK